MNPTPQPERAPAAQTPSKAATIAATKLNNRAADEEDLLKLDEVCRIIQQAIDAELTAAQSRIAAQDREIAQLKAKLHEIDLETEGGVDGAPDRSEHASLCNRIQAIIHPTLP